MIVHVCMSRTHTYMYRLTESSSRAKQLRPWNKRTGRSTSAAAENRKKTIWKGGKFSWKTRKCSRLHKTTTSDDNFVSQLIISCHPVILSLQTLQRRHVISSSPWIVTSRPRIAQELHDAVISDANDLEEAFFESHVRLQGSKAPTKCIRYQPIPVKYTWPPLAMSCMSWVKRATRSIHEKKSRRIFSNLFEILVPLASLGRCVLCLAHSSQFEPVKVTLMVWPMQLKLVWPGKHDASGCLHQVCKYASMHSCDMQKGQASWAARPFGQTFPHFSDNMSSMNHAIACNEMQPQYFKILGATELKKSCTCEYVASIPGRSWETCLKSELYKIRCQDMFSNIIYWLWHVFYQVIKMTQLFWSTCKRRETLPASKSAARSMSVPTSWWQCKSQTAPDPLFHQLKNAAVWFAHLVYVV